MDGLFDKRTNGSLNEIGNIIDLEKKKKKIAVEIEIVLEKNIFH